MVWAAPLGIEFLQPNQIYTHHLDLFLSGGLQLGCFLELELNCKNLCIRANLCSKPKDHLPLPFFCPMFWGGEDCHF